MDAMHTVIGYGGTRAFRLLWLLEELGLPHQHERIMPFSEDAKARTGGRLPAIELPCGQILLDSTAILAHLADSNNAFTFPAGSVERARQDALMQLVLEQIDNPLMLWTLAVQRRGAPISAEVQQWLGRRVVTGMHRVGEALGPGGEGPWVLGAAFTIADIVLGHCVHWAERYGLSTNHPRMQQHKAAVEQRPAYHNADCS